MTELSKAYEPHSIEQKWYEAWTARGYFQPSGEGHPYTIAIPPPNITGSLHMGHALQHTMMDALSRWRRMQGRSVLWLPGEDHAGIAAQVLVERHLAAEGVKRADIGREAFENRVWQWREESGGMILKQMRREGASVDWSRLRFTLAPDLSRAVREAFVRLYEEGLISRGAYIVNWCPLDQTSISDLEAPKKEVQSHLWHIAYPIKGTDESIVVATTRPETMLGDTAVAVHPEDERYRHLIGATVELPLTGRDIPVIADEAVEREFGTGVVKVTPAHDPADFQMGLRHNLPQVVVIAPDGRMTAASGNRYEGLDRAEARNLVVEDLKAKNLLVKTEEYTHSVGHHDRCGTVIEPMVSLQWFLNVRPLADVALKAVRDGRTRFVPAVPWTKVYEDWMENIQPWCISRQLWWGHRIPAWYCEGNHITVSRTDPTECATCGSSVLRQEEDVLDTWFSSALWPFSTLGWPDDTEDLRRFYPTNDMVTGYEIIFFWVARMMMMGLKFMDEVPFDTVLIHGIVRDSHGEKMSKMKGNTIDPITLFDRYGTDAVRFALAGMAVGSNDMALQESKMESARNFANKIWNASRFVIMNMGEMNMGEMNMGEMNLGEATRERRAPAWAPSDALADRWILAELNSTIEQVTRALEEYRFHEAAQVLYHFFWDDFCDWYIELSKPLVASRETTEQAAAARARLAYVLETSLRLLHPLMPFITEEIWQRLPHEGESIMIAPFPTAVAEREDVKARDEMQTLIALITKIRNIRSEMNIPARSSLKLLLGAAGQTATLVRENADQIKRLARVEEIEISDKLSQMDAAARDVVAGIEIAVPLAGLIDITKERERLTKEMARKETEARSLASRLENLSFVERAPSEVVEQARSRHAELIEEMEKLKATLGSLG
ncbi:MAG TPA: valine--tRNA ligase [Blastocatellia bacterium]|nr:valine--tRNA ligase [Blastocatellia bacterium]